MTKQKVRTYRSEILRQAQAGAPSLLSLKIVLNNARLGLPPRVSKKDMNEELALKLIGKMKTEYKKAFHFIS